MLSENGNGGNWVQFNIKGKGNNSYGLGAAVTFILPREQ
jgi:hypothetical protein